MTVPVESTYSVVKQALVTRLQLAGTLSSTNLLTHMPTTVEEIRTTNGKYEVVAMAEARNTYDDVVFTDGLLIFDETLLQTVVIEVHGVDSLDTQQVVDTRANEILMQVLAEVARQSTWDLAALGLADFDFVTVTPDSGEWHPGRLQQPTATFATSYDLVLEVRSRRSFTT